MSPTMMAEMVRSSDKLNMEPERDEMNWPTFHKLG